MRPACALPVGLLGHSVAVLSSTGLEVFLWGSF